MNKISCDLIKIICNFFEYNSCSKLANITITESKHNSLTMDSLRQCSKCLHNIINPIYFSQKIYCDAKLTVKEFNDFVHKYNLSLNLQFNNIIPIIFLNNYKIRAIMFRRNFNQKIELNTLPTSLKFLRFGIEFNQEIDKHVLPATLKYLIFSYYYNKEINDLPDSLEYLRFGWNFNKKITKLPQSLKILIFGTEFNHSLENILPSTLQILELGSEFNHSLENILPLKLQILKLNHWSNRTREILTSHLNKTHPLLKIISII
jgi:hypothetical protein